jgi:apolipoprotein N-acyltransferase
VAGAILYGRSRIEQTAEFLEQGPLVAAVQTHIPQSVKQSAAGSDQILEQLLELSKASSEAGAELIVWPETMVQATLDNRILKRITPAFHCKVVDEILREHAKDRAYVLVGGYGGTLAYEADLQLKLAERYNSAFLYTPDGDQAETQYDKIHLVPFGEVVPFRDSAPWLHNLLMKFTPYDYDYTLDSGQEYTVFEMKGSEDRQWRFGVMICYEDTVPAIARRFVTGKQVKGVDWLLNISNDGWFVRFTDGRVLPSTELAQHTAVCVFRAVENRVAVVRSVNTGISCMVDTLGRIQDGFLIGDLPVRAMARQGMKGWLVDRVPVDRRRTIFSACGQWLDFCCGAAFVCLIIVGIFGRFFIRNCGSHSQGRQNAKSRS